MGIITKYKPSEPIPIPSVTLQEASQLFFKLYNHKVDEVKAFDGFWAKTFYIKTFPNEAGLNAEEYVLKIIPLMLPNMREMIEINIAGMLHLKECGIVCSAPVKTQKGECFTIQELNCYYGNQSSSENEDNKGTKQSTGNFLVHVLTYVSGEMLHDAAPKSIPGEWYRALGKYLAKVDKAMLSYPHAQHIPTLAEYGQLGEWSLNTVPRYRKLLYVVEDSRKRRLLESMIDEFDKKVVPKMAHLRKAVLYGDFNDRNIIVKTTQPSLKHQPSDSKFKLDIIGIIDFNDMCYTCLLFEIGISLAYMMEIQHEGNIIEVGRYFLHGYDSILRLTDDEWDLLPVCVMGRCVQSILAGLYYHSRDPTNDYIIRHLDNAWRVGELLSSMSTQDIVAKWRGELE